MFRRKKVPLLNKTMKFVLMVVVAADIITLILAYPTIYFGAFALGLDTYNITQLVLRHIH